MVIVSILLYSKYFRMVIKCNWDDMIKMYRIKLFFTWDVVTDLRDERLWGAGRTSSCPGPSWGWTSSKTGWKTSRHRSEPSALELVCTNYKMKGLLMICWYDDFMRRICWGLDYEYDDFKIDNDNYINDNRNQDDYQW